ncbi:MAG: hypothetical protein HRT88_19685, partial [Lentisphaeraceae bacterium]|nr:hypothetical protein [Lentisphaeraceae bacterium]
GYLRKPVNCSQLLNELGKILKCTRRAVLNEQSTQHTAVQDLQISDEIREDLLEKVLTYLRAPNTNKMNDITETLRDSNCGTDYFPDLANELEEDMSNFEIDRLEQTLHELKKALNK